MKSNTYKNIHISIDQNMMQVFFYFLEKGVKKEIEVGCNIKTMLSDQLNISTDYIDNRIKTLFLDGRPVGDINSTMVNDGSTLALSAALPGLAGATFRRSEKTEPSQSTTIVKKEIKKSTKQYGVITIKLFNLVLRELGPAFLKSGALISKNELANFISRQPEKFLKACKSIKIDSKSSTIEEVEQIDFSDDSELLLLYVNSD